MSAIPARSPVSDVAEVLARARERGAWTPRHKAAIFHDLDRIEGRLANLRAAFFPNTLHAIAVKANPLLELLKILVKAGAGLEAASWEEVELARAAGCPAHRLVYDSPAKADDEIVAARSLGLWLNADNEEELARIESLGVDWAQRRGAKIGLRVNPQVGEGSIAFTSTVGRESKFGVPLDRAPELLVRYPFVTGLHVHTGSQGCGLELLRDAAFAVAEVAEVHGLEWLDIGGGLPVRYTDADPEPPSFVHWGESLAGMPGWGQRRLLTEVGRSIHAGCGWALARVEAVKDIEGVPTLVVALGADFLMRRVYRPEDWDHELVVLDPEGRRRGGERLCNVAGPLCFAGDMLARGRMLAPAQRGDLLLIRDAGAYTLSLWSRCCSRGLPPSFGYRGDGRVVALHLGERPRDVVEFWSLPGS